MTAVCWDGGSQAEVRFPLMEVSGEENLHYEPKPGMLLKTNVPKFMLNAVKKRPAAALETKKDEIDDGNDDMEDDTQKQTKKKRKKRKKPKEAGADKVGAEAPKEAKAGRSRVIGKQAQHEESPVVDGLFLCQAKQGNIRTYVLAKCGSAKKLLVEITKKNHDKHKTLVASLHSQMQEQVAAGVDYQSLKAWARAQKQSVLS